MKKITYQVQGSSPEPYNITIKLDGINLSFDCDCPAGTYGSHCKHWMGVFEGKKQEYINLNENQIEEIQSWLSGSDLEEIWNRLNVLKEKEKKIIKERKLVLKEFQTAAMKN